MELQAVAPALILPETVRRDWGLCPPLSFQALCPSFLLVLIVGHAHGVRDPMSGVRLGRTLQVNLVEQQPTIGLGAARLGGHGSPSRRNTRIINADKMFRMLFFRDRTKQVSFHTVSLIAFTQLFIYKIYTPRSLSYDDL